jgi:hypothetical protein
MSLFFPAHPRAIADRKTNGARLVAVQNFEANDNTTLHVLFKRLIAVQRQTMP